MKHSELPWYLGQPTEEGLSVVDNGQVYGMHPIEAEFYDAAFIVKAVNNHYQLLEALEKIVRQTEDMIPPFRAMGADQMMKIAREAIKQAEE